MTGKPARLCRLELSASRAIGGVLHRRRTDCRSTVTQNLHPAPVFVAGRILSRLSLALNHRANIASKQVGSETCALFLPIIWGQSQSGPATNLPAGHQQRSSLAVASSSPCRASSTNMASRTERLSERSVIPKNGCLWPGSKPSRQQAPAPSPGSTSGGCCCAAPNSL